MTLKDAFTLDSLPTREAIDELLDCVYNALRHEGRYRARGGGLLDFRGAPLWTVVVPDIHARYWFIKNILDYRLPSGGVILDELALGHARVICLGDALHAEARAYIRWLLAQEEECAGEYIGTAMQEEMLEGLKTLLSIFILKTNYTSGFHILKGNHENIRNESVGGDRGFIKFADEGEQVKQFILSWYGEDILDKIARYEHSLPIMAIGDGFVLSHAEPRRPIDRASVIDYKRGNAIYDLTWTDNGDAIPGSVDESIRLIWGRDYKEGQRTIWITGHRPVEDNYSLRQGGHLVQIHNPERENIAIIPPDGRFDPNVHIYDVNPTTIARKEGICP